MKNSNPRIKFWGIGGERMKQVGVDIFISSSKMAVVGLTEVFSKLYTIFKASRKIKSILKNKRPDLLILIDYPDFNLHIAGIAKNFRIPVLYYISPQVWAWRKGRVKKIARLIDRMVVILPFEKEFYRQRGVNVDYVGHPLLDSCSPGVLNERLKIQSRADENYPIVGLLPGSRTEEVIRLLPVMIKSSEILKGHYPDIRFLLLLAPTIRPEFVQPFIDDSSVKIKVIRKDIDKTLDICHIALVASGTATLETAIIGIPMVIVYKLSTLTYWLGRIILKVPFIGLVNLVAGEKIVPELTQNDVTPDKLAHELLSILDDADTMAEMKDKLKAVKDQLGMGGASEKTAKIAMELMRQKHE